ncbi:unnamed protein product [Allacma fusca]|uniref:Gamma-glutamyl transpeptidase n=1 Tax=Allacma fusca TaxID=39272 RepID=A0A8J2KB15_9HEXA|nr:unnamed protein product [Allacma fusca]
MFSEKTRLTEKRENPFYGSYKEHTILEEVNWQNKKKKRQLTIVSVVIVILVALAIGITLAITLPPVLDRQVLDPPDPQVSLGPSPSLLGQYSEAGVSTEAAACTDIGSYVLNSLNGSAVDAAVAVGLCLGVVAPQSSGIGGGLFMTIYNDGKMYAVNARETAPAGVEPQRYEDDLSLAYIGGPAVGVPGELAGLYEAHSRFGSVEWSELVGLAHNLAANGFQVTANLANSLVKHVDGINADPALRSEFIDPSTEKPWLEGATIRRPLLGETLKKIQSGITDFYSGSLATAIQNEISASGGVLTAKDLADYKVDWQEPFSYEFKNQLTIFGPNFPSSAPIVTLALNILDGYGRKHPQNMSAVDAALDIHQLAEVLKFADAHRARISDPAFTNLSALLDDVLSPQYADGLRSRIEKYKTFEDPTYYGGVFAQATDAGTAHASIIGPNGDAVSFTTTINHGFGAGFMGSTTGIIYNNELADFSFTNASDPYGLPPNHNNFIEPGKRPASSMAPVIFLNSKGQPVLATGGAGGSKILPAVVTTTWRALYRDMDIKAAIDEPRISANFEPSEIEYEYGLLAQIVKDMERRGHRMRRLNVSSYIGNVNSVCRTRATGLILANADYRKRGTSAGF